MIWGMSILEFTSAAPATAANSPDCVPGPSTLWCNAPLVQEAGHPNYGLAKQLKISLSHCPGKMDARCSYDSTVDPNTPNNEFNTKIIPYFLNPLAGNISIISYQHLQTYDPIRDRCSFDTTKPIYMNIQSRCVDESGNPAPCLMLNVGLGA